MVFDHKVKYNGVWYMPGEEIKNEVGEKKTSTFCWSIFCDIYANIKKYQREHESNDRTYSYNANYRRPIIKV